MGKIKDSGGLKRPAIDKDTRLVGGAVAEDLEGQNQPVRTRGPFPVPAKEKVEVYDEQGRKVSTDVLRKHDLLVVYWHNPRDHSVTFHVQGTDLHCSFIECDHADHQGLWGRVASRSDWGLTLFSWTFIDKIHVSGHDTTGRTISFIEMLWQRKDKAEKAAQQMRANIDALKA